MESIFNTLDFHFQIETIRTHSAFPESRIKETIERQKDLYQFWQNQFQSMRIRPQMSSEEQNAYQLKLVQQLVDHAFSNTEFYNDFYRSVGYSPGEIRSWSDFEKLPLVTKDHLRDHFPRNVCRHLNHEKLYGVRTSGSSGRPVTIVLDDRRAHIDTLHRIRQFEILAGTPLPEQGWIYNLHHTKWWFTSMLGLYPTLTVRQDCPTADLIHHIRQLKPSVISSLPSALKKIADQGMNLKELGVLCVSTNSESSTLKERKQLSSVFGVPVGDEYSSEELGLIATECSHGKYHLVEDESYIEILSESRTSEFGKVIGTDLWNYAMPIIRYDQGDFAKLATGSKCECGNHFRVLEGFQGRTDQNFINQSGQIISSSDLLDLCDEYLVPESSRLLEFKLIQKSRAEVTLMFVCHPEFTEPNPEIIRLAKQKLEALMGHSVLFNLQSVTQMPASPSYKRRMVISEVKV